MAKSSPRDEEPKALVRHEAPAFIMEAIEEGDDSLEVLSQKQVLPKAIIVQGLSADDLKVHGIGSVIVSSTKILGADESMDVVPVFFFDEYVVERDRRDKSGPKIMARTFDDRSEIAIKSEDRDRRFEVYEGGPKDNPFRYRYVHCFRYACVIYGDSEFAGQPIILTFAKGDAIDGTAWQGAILMRKVGGKKAPLWSQVWTISCVQKTNANGEKWWGLRHSAPGGSPWVSAEDGPEFRKLYNDLKEAHSKNLLAVEENDDKEAVEEDEDKVF